MAKKSFLDLEDLTRWLIREKTKGQLQDTPDIQRALNDEVTALYNEIVQAFEDYWLVSANTRINLEQDSYFLDSLPKGWNKIRYVEREESSPQKLLFPIFPMDVSDKEIYDDANLSTGIPERFFIKNDLMVLRFKPNQRADGMRLRIWYIHLPVKMVASTDVPIIPENHNEIIAWGAARRCMVREGQDTTPWDSKYAELKVLLMNDVEERQIMEPRFVNDFEDIYNDNRYLGRFF